MGRGEDGGEAEEGVLKRKTFRVQLTCSAPVCRGDDLFSFLRRLFRHANIGVACNIFLDHAVYARTVFHQTLFVIALSRTESGPERCLERLGCGKPFPISAFFIGIVQVMLRQSLRRLGLREGGGSFFHIALRQHPDQLIGDAKDDEALILVAIREYVIK